MASDGKSKKTKKIVIVTAIIVVVLFLLVVGAVAAVIIFAKVSAEKERNNRTPMEELVYTRYQDLKDYEVDPDSITPTHAVVFKYTMSDGSVEYEVLIQYEKNGFMDKYFAFENDGRRLGDGMKDENHDNPVWEYNFNDNVKVNNMKDAIRYFYLTGNQSDYHPILVTEEEAENLDTCAVMVSVDKIY